MGGIFSRPAPPAPAPVAPVTAASTTTDPVAAKKRRALAEGRTLSESTTGSGDGTKPTKTLLGE